MGELKMISRKLIYFIVIVFFFIIFLFFNELMGLKDRKIQLFYPLEVGMEWETAKKVCKIIPDSISEIIIGSIQLPANEVILSNGIKATIVFNNDSNEKCYIQSIFTKDKNFNYEGFKIGTPVYKIIKYLKNPQVKLHSGFPKEIHDENFIWISMSGIFSKCEPKKIWMSDIVHEIGQSVSYTRVNPKLGQHFVKKSFSLWLKEEGNKDESAKAFSPLKIGMKRSEVLKLVKLHKNYKKGSIDCGIPCLLYNTTLPNGVKVRIGFCSSQSPGTFRNYLIKDKDPVLYFIETQDHSFRFNSNLRVGISLKEAIKSSSIKWDIIGDTTMVFFKNGICLILEKGIQFYSLNEIPNVPILAIQELPIFRFALASFP